MKSQRALTDEISTRAMKSSGEQGLDNFASFLDAHPEYIPNGYPDLYQRSHTPPDVHEWWLKERPTPGKIRIEQLPELSVDPESVGMNPWASIRRSS